MRKIKFEQIDSAMGSDYLTICPFGMKGRYTHEIIGVGSRACHLCKHYGGVANDYVKCNFERNVSILQKKKHKDILD